MALGRPAADCGAGGGPGGAAIRPVLGGVGARDVERVGLGGAEVRCLEERVRQRRHDPVRWQRLLCFRLGEGGCRGNSDEMSPFSVWVAVGRPIDCKCAWLEAGFCGGPWPVMSAVTLKSSGDTRVGSGFRGFLARIPSSL